MARVKGMTRKLMRPIAALAVAFLIAFLNGIPAQAELLRIIHVNDLHSMMDHGQTLEEGGYAAVKGMMDELKHKSQKEGMDTLVLNAGDFMEGSPYYLADRGRESFRVMNGMGFDAAVIGNHDWMMGTEELNQIVEEIPPLFAFLGANFLTHSNRQALREHLQPYKIFDRSGAKIAVLGLTTNEWIYKSPADRVVGPIHTAHRLMKELKSQSDFVIALTHLGVSKDEKLVQKTRGIDLVVGGHSHTVLAEPVIAQNPDGQKVAIVQTGAHGQYVGELVVDVVPGSPLEVKSYELHAVNLQSPRDPQIQVLVQHARQALDAEYGASWLQEVVGFSEVNATPSSHDDNPWNRFVTDSFMDSTGADAVLHVTSFTHPFNTTGSITREGLFAFFPRLENLDERKGWSIWTARMPGILLKELKKLGEKAGLYIALQPADGGRIHDAHEYTLAFPEGIALRSKEIPGLNPLIFHRLRNSHVPIWESLETHFREIGTLKSSQPGELQMGRNFSVSATPE